MSSEPATSESNGLLWRLWLVPTLANAAILSLFLFCAPPGERVPNGDVVVSLIMGLVGTAMISVPLCIGSDALRRCFSWRRWTICPTMVLVAVCFAFLIWLALPPAKSGFRSVSDVLYFGGCVILAPSLTFGILFTMLGHDATKEAE